MKELFQRGASSCVKGQFVGSVLAADVYRKHKGEAKNALNQFLSLGIDLIGGDHNDRALLLLDSLFRKEVEQRANWIKTQAKSFAENMQSIYRV